MRFRNIKLLEHYVTTVALQVVGGSLSSSDITGGDNDMVAMRAELPASFQPQPFVTAGDDCDGRFVVCHSQYEIDF